MWIAGILAAGAATPSGLVREGNEAFEVGSYDEALKLYKKAAKERPDSPEIAFDQGAALYRKKDFAGSAQRFAEAAQKAEDPALRAKAEFNLGNCRFRQSEQDREAGDVPAATKAAKESVGHFREALRLSPAQREAAENLELARRSLKALMEVQQQQPQQQQGQDQKEDGEKQEQQQAQGMEQQEGQEKKSEESQAQEGKDQEGKEAEKQPGDEKKNKDEAKAAAEDQDSKKDDKKEPAAVAKDDKDDKGEEKKDETARAILEEEKETQQRRMKMPLKFKPVEKDW